MPADVRGSPGERWALAGRRSRRAAELWCQKFGSIESHVASWDIVQYYETGDDYERHHAIQAAAGT